MDCKLKTGIILLTGLLALALANNSYAQANTTRNTGSSTGSAPDPTTGARPTTSTATLGTTPNSESGAKTLSLDNAPPVSPAEEEAYKGFQDAPNSDAAKKIAIGEDFAQKYPASRYLPVIYANLTMLYLQTNQVQKMEEVGEKEVLLTPTDVQTMAILGQTIPRAMTNGGGPDAAKELAKAEAYSKRAIEVTPTIAKPANLTDEQFVSAKNTTLAMAYSGLGLVYVRRGKFEEAIPELDQSVKIDPVPDPVNYYLLGLANQKASHFDAAVAAYTKCSTLQSSMQETCKSSAEAAKKMGTTQLSVPK
jgi:tetratricopeptide (TPR) repeat protein